MTRTKELALGEEEGGPRSAAEGSVASVSTLSVVKSSKVSEPSWFGNSQPDDDEGAHPSIEVDVQGVVAAANTAQEGSVEDGQKSSAGTSSVATSTNGDHQAALDETVRAYIDPETEFVYYETLRPTKVKKSKASPVLGNSEGEASSADDVTPSQAAAESDSPQPTSAPNNSQTANDASAGKYPFYEFTALENFEAYLSGAPEMSYEELYRKIAVVQQTLAEYQNEWSEIDKVVYNHEEAEKFKAKIASDEAKAQSDMEQAEEDTRVAALQIEYKDYLTFSRKDWADSFTKHYEARYADMDTAEETKAKATLALLNRIRDPFFMKGFFRRQKAIVTQKWDSKLVEKPLPESKQTKEERDLDERKRKYLTDRITFDDMNRADAYGYVYNALDLSRGDQKLPNLRVIAKAKNNKRTGKQAELEIDFEASRPKRARKGVVTESGENSEALSPSEEETPLPEKRRGRGQNAKLAEVAASLSSAAEAAKKAAAKTYLDDGGVRRYVASGKPSGRPAAPGAAAAKGKGRAAAKSKLDQMSRAVSESDEINESKRRADDEDDIEEPAAKRSKTPMGFYPSHLPPAQQPINSIASILNPEPEARASGPAPQKRKRAIAAASSTQNGTIDPTTGNIDTAENTEDDGQGGKKSKKTRLKTEQERKVQSEAMKENWKNPSGKMRMGIERRNRRAARKKFETTRIAAGGAPNPNVIYKSDDDGFSFEYFGETKPTTPLPLLAPSAVLTAGYSNSDSATPSEAAQDTFTPEDDYEVVGKKEDQETSFSAPSGFAEASKNKKTRASRPAKLVHKKSRSMGYDGAADEDEDGDDSSGKSERGESVYEQYLKITSPTGNVHLGKRKSIPRQPLPTYGTTSGEDEGEASDFQ